MCSVIAGIGAALSIFSGYSQYQSQKAQIQAQADSQASMYRAQAQADEYNAKLREQEAKVEAKKQEQIADQYGEEAKRLRARQRLAEGKLRAQTGAAGLDMSGSAMDILSSGQEAYWQDQMTLLGNQRNDNYNSRVQQSNYLREAENNRTSAANNRTAASNVLADADRQISALRTSTILGTAASIVPMFGGGGSSSSNASSSKTNFGTLSANAGHGHSWNYNTATGASSITGGWKLGQSNYKNYFTFG